MPAGLAAGGCAEAPEDFHECEEFVSAFGQQHRIQSRLEESDEEVECHAVGLSEDAGGQRAGRKLVHGVLCDTGAGATVADGPLAFLSFRSSRVRGVGKGRLS